MPESKIATRDEWKTFKTKYGVADGAAKGVDLGPELDSYWKIVRAPKTVAKQMFAAREHLEIVFSNYVKALDMKKVKDPKFQQAFLDNYLGQIHKVNEDAKRYKASAATYKSELGKLATTVMGLKPATVTKDDLEKFKSGPVRGVSAMGKSLAGFDVHAIDALLGQINNAVQKLPPNPDRETLKTFVANTVKVSKAIAQEAINAGLADGDYAPVQPQEYF